MSDIERLKACPFCKAKCSTFHVPGVTPFFLVVDHFDGCPMAGSKPYWATEAEAIKAWNTRAPDPSLQSKLAEAERALTEISGLTARKQLPITHQINEIATAALASIREEEPLPAKQGQD